MTQESRVPSKVVPLHAPGDWEVRAPMAPVPSLVLMLERMLEDAKTGRLQSVAVASVNHLGGHETHWAGSYQAAGVQTMGAIAYLMHEYAK